MISFGNKSERENRKEERKMPFTLVLHNDEVNTFDHVIESLCLFCNHQPDQAEQCALLTHLTGKCEIKKGELDEIVKMHTELMDQKLQVTIE